MRFRIGPWPLALILVLACGAVLALLYWQRQRERMSNAFLAARLPSDQAIQVFVDVNALRSAGLLDMLAGSPTVEEPDYRRFVEGTGFNYRQDLDAVFASKRGEDLFCLLRGRFDWAQLRNYAVSAGGNCRNAFCTVGSERPDRYVSFYPLLTGVLAVAVAADPLGAYVLAGNGGTAPAEEEIRHPVWIRLGAGALAGRQLPAGTAMLASAVQSAERVTLALDASGGAFEALLKARCKNTADAGRIAGHLSEMTDMLRKFLAREKVTPSPADLSAVLAGGEFRAEQQNVIGKWPLRREFLESLTKAAE